MHLEYSVSQIHSMCSFVTGMLMIVVQWNPENVQRKLWKNNKGIFKKKEERNCSQKVWRVSFDALLT